MVTLRSTRYPGLVLSGLGVRFVDGVLETSDPVVVARARRLAGLGVVVEGPVGGLVGVERRDRPRGNASREAWADYAQSVGVEVGDDWTRNQIRDAVGEVERDG